MGRDVTVGAPESARSTQRRRSVKRLGKMAPKKTATRADTASVAEVGGPSGPSKVAITPKVPMNTRTIIPSPTGSSASERSEARNPREKRVEVAQHQPVLPNPEPAL